MVVPCSGSGELPALFDPPFFKVHDPSGSDEKHWKKEYEDSDLRFQNFDGVSTLECFRCEKPWNSLYREVTVNLSRLPVLQIRVLASSKHWFLIVEGSQFPNGFLRLTETGDSGLFTFDIAKLSGLSGPQTFNVKLGLSNPGAEKLGEAKVSFNTLSFVNPSPDQLVSNADANKTLAALQGQRDPKQEGCLYVLDPDDAHADLWQESVPDGPHEVRFQQKNGVGIVKGKITERNWGAVHRPVTVDLKKCPILQIRMVSSSKNWYLILTSPAIKEGFVRLKDSSEEGLFEFNVAQITGLTGDQTFDLQVGLSNPTGDTLKGEWAAFDLLRFKQP